MRRTTLGMAVASALVLSACGGGSGSLANQPRPPVTVNLSVFVNDQRVSVSPATVGAGPVQFTVTNSATKTESVTVQSPDAQTLASTGPINPQATAQVTVDFHDQGDYTVATGARGNEAAVATQAGIQPATVHISSARRSASNQLLLP